MWLVIFLRRFYPLERNNNAGGVAMGELNSKVDEINKQCDDEVLKILSIAHAKRAGNIGAAFLTLITGLSLMTKRP